MRKYPTNRIQISYLCEHHLLSIYAMVKYWITWAFLSIIFLTDWYFYRNLRLRLKNAPAWLRKGLIILQFVMGAFYSTYFIADTLSQGAILGRHFKIWVIRSFFVIYIPKLIGTGLLILEDVIIIGRRLLKKRRQAWEGLSQKSRISRSEFISKASIVVTGLPLATMAYGISKGSHDYHIKRLSLNLPNLPKAFDGLRIAQLSDIHAGSFFNKTAVQGGVDMLLAEKPDIFCFTGDLVNSQTKEMEPYLDIFKQIKAPLGSFSVLGNHDYGHYKYWDSNQAKAKNLRYMLKMHELLGWDLLMDENRIIQVDGESLALLGVQNWGTRGKSFKYGRLDSALEGVEEIPNKILLSHDPSHWDAQIRPEFPEIQLTLAGHTHGMQCGIDVDGWQWSPIKYVYKQWMDLYQEGDQYIYVNRGFGYADIFPGRVGILPEITLIELKTA